MKKTSQDYFRQFNDMVRKDGMSDEAFDIFCIAHYHAQQEECDFFSYEYAKMGEQLTKKAN